MFNIDVTDQYANITIKIVSDEDEHGGELRICSNGVLITTIYYDGDAWIKLCDDHGIALGK